MEKKASIEQLFPDSYRDIFLQVIRNANEVQEIRLRTGQPVVIVMRGKEYFLNKRGMMTMGSMEAYVLEAADLETILNHICHYSIYAYEDEIRQGFLTVQGGHRIGVAGQVIMRNESEVKGMKYIRYMNIRISHEICGVANDVLPYLYKNGNLQSTLIISLPGVGKTTLLRDMVRQISDGNKYGEGMPISVVDERSEIAGCFRGIAQNDVGMRTDVLDACPKEIGMMMLLRSMAPKVVAVDEIGSKTDEIMIRRMKRSGVKMLATIHGNDLHDLLHNEMGQSLVRETIFERYIVLRRKPDGVTEKKIYDEELQECFVC